MTAIATVDHSIEAPLVVLDPDVLMRAEVLVESAKMFDGIDEANLEAADNTLREIAGLEKEIEKSRKAVKGPVLDLGKAIDKAAKEAGIPLTKAKKDLSEKVAVHVRAVEAERRRIEEENRRKIEEAQRKADEERKKREEAAKPGLLGRIMGKEPEPVPEPTAPIPVALEQEPEKVRSAVSIRTVKKLQIIDENQIPREIGGVKLWKLDETALTKILKAGIPVPGAALVDVEQLATRSG